jgi:ubiquinone/menaquinone biosynthesis C-methylase UbiE
MSTFPVTRPCPPVLVFADGRPERSRASAATADDVPDNLQTHYWWAYIHPAGVRLFARQWLVNLILWGNYSSLSDAALSELGETLPGRTLQVACVYGDLTARVSRRAAVCGGTRDVVDVLPLQLRNLHHKLPAETPARLMVMDSTRLQLADRTYDRGLLFFLLHEQPAAVRRQTLREAFRVVKPGGKVVIVDYARPHWWNPLRYLWRPLLALLEPFALELWRDDITAWMPASGGARLTSRRLFGGLYQMVVVTKGPS